MFLRKYLWSFYSLLSSCELILVSIFLSSLSGFGEEPSDVCCSRGGGGVEGADQGAV